MNPGPRCWKQPLCHPCHFPFSVLLPGYCRRTIQTWQWCKTSIKLTDNKIQLIDEINTPGWVRLTDCSLCNHFYNLVTIQSRPFLTNVYLPEVHSNYSFSVIPSCIVDWQPFKLKNELSGQWLWQSWQRGCFRYQRTQAINQSSAYFIDIYLLLTVCRKDETKEKEAEDGPVRYCRFNEK